jgi:hypothetical protein
MQYDLYNVPNNNFIPDVKLVKVSGDSTDRTVEFLWRGVAQTVYMSRENEYGDGEWTVTYGNYTEEFDNWLDENLENYDSLEFMFDLQDIIPTEYELEFDV